MTHTTRAPMSSSKKALIALLVMVLGLGGAAFGAFWWLERSLAANVESLGDPFDGLSDRPTASATPSEGEPSAMNFLVLGSDSRISAGDPSQWEAGAQRTDTIMLVHVPSSHDQVFVMSIPRDSWVEIPGYGEAKINAAFSYGGPTLAIETVESLTGVRIDHFVMTDFESFKAITDALGGVQLTLQNDLTVGDTVIPAGQHQLLTGEQALAFVRERYSLPRGDFDRVQRQQAWVRAIVARVRNEGTLRNPIAAQQFLDTVTKSVAADDGLDAAVMSDLRDMARDLGSDDIVFFTVPYTGTGTSADGQSIVRLNRDLLAGIMGAVASDTMAEYMDANGEFLETLPAVVD